MSLPEVDEPTLAEIAKTCDVSGGQIEDIYTCTAMQISTMAESAIHMSASVFRCVLNLPASIDSDRFSNALQQVVALRPVLRTRIVSCRYGILQVVTNEGHCMERHPPSKLNQYLRTDRAQPMGFGKPLFRSATIGRKVILTFHHAIADHASLTPLFADIWFLYSGFEIPKRPEFKEFVKSCLSIDEPAVKAFWESRFKGVPAVFPKVAPGSIPLATQTIIRKINPSRINKEISDAHMPSFIEAAWALTASSYTNSQSVAFGMVLSGRAPAAALTDYIVGPTIAIVPVQINLKNDITVGEIIRARAVARRQLQSHDALQYGLSNIRTVCEAARCASEFQTLLNVRAHWSDHQDSTGITFDPGDDAEVAFALALSFDIQGTTITVQAASDPTAVCERQLGRILNQFEHYFISLVEAPLESHLGQLPRLNPHDISEIYSMNHGLASSSTVEKCVHDLFSAQAQEHPVAAAVDAHDGSASYGELDELSDRLADELIRQGVSAGAPIAWIFEKSLWAIVSLLGLLKAGGACVPIAASDPHARKATIIAAAEVKTVVTSAAEYANSVELAPSVVEVSAKSISSLPKASNIEREKIPASSLIYVLFTSGSTGTPKGVLLEHRNLASSLESYVRRFGWDTGYRILQFASPVWDASIGEIFGALLSGACLCIPSEETRVSNLAGYIAASNVNCAWLTPTVLRTLTPEEVPSLQMLLSVGEAISPDAASTWGRNLRLFNAWGPCETVVMSASAELKPDCSYPETIGTPVNCNIWIVNPNNIEELAPIGAVGEMLIDGPGVGRGYLNDEAKTRTAFVKPPSWALSYDSRPRILYRTGDLAKYNEDGSFCFIGRQDTQVKIRGQRLELGEIESVLAACAEVRDVVATTKICNGRTELIAVTCLSDPSLPDEVILGEIGSEHTEVVVRRLRAVREHARSTLPSYMVPSIWLAVTKMPRMASEKLDRVSINQWLKKLHIPDAKAELDPTISLTTTAPVTANEKLLQSVLATVLSIPAEEIGRESCFSQLGGDSIAAIRIASQALKCGLQITTASLLQNIPLAQIARSAKRTSMTSIGSESIASTVSWQDRHTERMAAILDSVKDQFTDLKDVAIDAIVPATDMQANILALGEIGGRAYYGDFILEFTPCLDTTRLKEACKKVIQHHAILRTVFVSYGPQLYQIILRDWPWNIIVDEETEGPVPIISFHKGDPLVCFHLLGDNQQCRRLRVEIHHALYDALSLGLVFSDLDAAYAGQALSDGPEFHSWVSHMDTLDKSPANKFWKAVLQDAKMPLMVPPPPEVIRGHPLDEHLSIHVPLRNMETSFGTQSNVLKAAWSLVISMALGTTDVLFGEVSANRFLELPGTAQVKGPCVNVVPVRARLDWAMTLAALVTQMQDLSISGMPHHHLDTNSIIRDCTSWTRHSRFSTVVVYQNHKSFGRTVRIGDTNATFSKSGMPGDCADVHVLAYPGSDGLEIEFLYSAQTILPENVQWMAKALEKVLEQLPEGLDRTLCQINSSLRPDVGTYEMPSSRPPPFSGHMEANAPTVSPQAREIVSLAWEQLELPTTGKDQDGSIWDSASGVVVALLLSEHYRQCGYDINSGAIIRNPTRSMQGYLIDLLNLTGSKKDRIEEAAINRINSSVHGKLVDRMIGGM